MVHVAVGEDDGADMRLVFNQVGDIGDNNIHSQQLRLREHQPGVDHDNVVFPAEREAVHAELAKTAQGNDFQFFCLHLSDSMLTPMEICCFQSSMQADRLEHCMRLFLWLSLSALSFCANRRHREGESRQLDRILGPAQIY